MHEGDDLDIGDRDGAEKLRGAEVGLRGLDVAGEHRVHQLLQQDRQAEGGQQRDEQVAVDHAEHHQPVERPADEEQHDRRDHHPEQRMDAVPEQDHGDIAAEHDELALGDVDDVHHAPDQRHAVGGEREDRPHQQAIDDQVGADHRRLEQKHKIIDHGNAPVRDTAMSPPNEKIGCGRDPLKGPGLSFRSSTISSSPAAESPPWLRRTSTAPPRRTCRSGSGRAPSAWRCSCRSYRT